MPPQHGSAPPAPPCKFFINGCCRKGSACPFSHEGDGISNMTCRYWLLGNCAYGDRCMYEHALPKASTYTAPPPPSAARSNPSPATSAPSAAAVMDSSCAHHSATGARTATAGKAPPSPLDLAHLSLAPSPAAAGGTANGHLHSSAQTTQSAPAHRSRPPSHPASPGLTLPESLGDHDSPPRTCVPDPDLQFTSDQHPEQHQGGGSQYYSPGQHHGYSELHQPAPGHRRGMAAWAGGTSSGHPGHSRQVRQHNLQDFPPLQGDGGLSPTSPASASKGKPSNADGTSHQGHTEHRDDGSVPEVKQEWEEWEGQDWQPGAGGAAADNRAGNADGAGAWAGGSDDWDAAEDDGFGEDDDWFRPYQPQSLHQGSHYDQQGDTTGEGWVPDSSDPADTPLCPAWAAYASCPRGEECDLIHGDECEVCNKRLLHPYNPEARSAHETECRARHAKLMARLRSAHVECSICMEKVLSAPSPGDRRFGLMACEHPFCLRCIREWRKTSSADVDSAVRTCPVCRTPTFFVTPSAVWPETPEEKEAIMEAYKVKLSSIDCAHFRRGEGTCPFGTSCFYRHMYPDGRLESRTPDLRFAKSAEGDSKVLGTVRLSDFLEIRTTGRSRGLGRRR